MEDTPNLAQASEGEIKDQQHTSEQQMTEKTSEQL